MQFQFPHCEICHDTRHIRTGPRAVRLCSCIAQVINIKPLVRGSEFRYPEKYNAYPPYSLTNLITTVGGGHKPDEYTAFRYMVWRSLLACPETLTYEYMLAYRLTDMQFDKDPTYNNPRDLVDLDLVIISLARADVPNRLLAPLLVQVLTLRSYSGKPTWIYSPLSIGRVREEYSAGVSEMIEPIGRVHP